MMLDRATKLDHVLLWMDLETTGLDLQSCTLLEVGWMLTDLHFFMDLTTCRATFPTISGADPVGASLAEDNFVTQMHRTSGLWRARARAVATQKVEPVNLIEQMILDEVGEHLVEGGGLTLAGSGISSFDLPLIRRDMPTLAKSITYWTIDISQVERFVKLANGQEPRGSSADAAHRVIPDIQHALSQARIFRDFVRT